MMSSSVKNTQVDNKLNMLLDNNDMSKLFLHSSVRNKVKEAQEKAKKVREPKAASSG